MNKLALFLIVFVAAESVVAGRATAGALFTVHFMNNGAVIVYTDGVRSDIPNCALNYFTRFVIDGTTDAGKLQVSGILAFYLAGKKTYIIGTGACGAGYDSEEVRYFYSVD